MIHIDLGNVVFAIALIVGLVLLLVTVVLDDVVGGVLDGMHMGIDVGGVSVAPIALGFVSMFGIGGLFGTTVLDLPSSTASIIGALAGAGGGLLVWGMFAFMARGQSEEAYSISDLVGVSGRVVVSIPKGHYGEVMVSFGGMSQKRTATADADIPAGKTVTITSVAGSVLVVEAAQSAPEPTRA